MAKNELTIEPTGSGEFNVYEWGTYPRSSVLAGQTMKHFRGQFETLEAAQAAYPGATYDGSVRSAHNHFDHLPGEDDLVPGGAYPDDVL